MGNAVCNNYRNYDDWQALSWQSGNFGIKRNEADYKGDSPAASPSILAGFVNSLRSSFVMLVYAEMYGAGEGMGYFVKKYAELGIFANTWVGFVFMVIILVIVMQAFELLKKHLLKWTMWF